MTDRRRLFRAQFQDISVEEEIGYYEYVVAGARNISYKVDLREPSCSCPDWEKREPEGGCKHILAVKLHNGDIDPLPSAKVYTGSGTSSHNRNIPDWDSLAEQTKERDGWECQRCEKKGGEYGQAELHAHHILPRSKGGDDTSDNLITLCRECHESLHGHRIPTSDRSNWPVNQNSDSGSSNEESPSRSSTGITGTTLTDLVELAEERSDDESNENTPNKCDNCGKFIEHDSSGRNICDHCLEDREPREKSKSQSTIKQSKEGPRANSEATRSKPVPNSESSQESKEGSQDDHDDVKETEDGYNPIAIFQLFGGIVIAFDVMWRFDAAYTDAPLFASASVIVVGISSLLMGLKDINK